MQSRRMRAPQWLAKCCWLACVGLGMSVGCGQSSNGSVARLSGEVTLDGQPLPGNSLASVTFQPRGGGGRPITAEIAAGKYDCPAVPKGDVVAQMSITVPTGHTYRSDRTGQNVEELENVVLAPDQARGIPLQVGDDANVNFELKRAK
jgi:hypothetical protein